MKTNFKAIRPKWDNHFHFGKKTGLIESARILQAEADEWNIVRIGNPSLAYEGRTLYPRLQNLTGMALKKLLRIPSYAYACLTHDLSLSIEEQAASYVEQAKRFREAGFDGLKMLEGIAGTVFEMGRFPSHPVYDPLFSYLEETGFPVLLHMGSPEEMWDKSKMDPYALAHGWWQGPDKPKFDEYHKAVFDMMDKHPNMKLVLAHFGFFSYRPERVEAFFTRYPNARLDTTPACMEIVHICEHLDIWLPIFEKYGDRILYGSDDFDVEGDCIRPTVLHNFFEEEGEHDYVGHPYRSIKLSEATLQNIYHDSAYRLYGEPKEGNLPLLLEMAEEIRAKIEPSSDEMKELDTIVKILKS